MSEGEAALLQGLEEFTAVLRGAFRRQDQVRWSAVYLQGLLRARSRKTIKNLARAVTLPPGLCVEDVAQALQHFINQSPWDEDALRRRYLGLMATRLAGPDGLFVVEELAFVKQGRHSVGVQRQYSRSLGRKANCQVAVALHHVRGGLSSPLALRLYLPRSWAHDGARLEAAGVPPFCRGPRDRTALALDLLDEVLAAGVPGAAVAAGTAWESSPEFRAGVAARGLSYLGQVPPGMADVLRHGTRQLQETLGLDHFEGRSWRGFHHHACLVLLAYGFLTLWPDATARLGTG